MSKSTGWSDFASPAYFLAGSLIDECPSATWYFRATHSRLPPIIKVAKTIPKHQAGILRWFISGINNGILEGINSLVQAAKAKARGYRSDRNLATIIYLIVGKLDLSVLPT